MNTFEKLESHIGYFFDQKCKEVENGTTYIHVAGSEKKIKNGKDYEWSKIVNNEYDDSPFEAVILNTLENKIPRLD